MALFSRELEYSGSSHRALKLHEGEHEERVRLP
jgi:hypothetical protein